MDTRNKILTASEALAELRARTAPSPLQVVAGYFDPVLAVHARRLNELAGSAGKLMVVLSDPERPLLSQRARAELVAALDSVEYVVMAGASAADFLRQIPALSAVHEEEADTQRTQSFIRHVLDKQMVPHG